MQVVPHGRRSAKPRSRPIEDQRTALVVESYKVCVADHVPSWARVAKFG